MKLLVIEQMRKAVSASGAEPDSRSRSAAAAGVQELAVERDAVGDAGRAELVERLGEQRVDGRGDGAHARGPLGIDEALVDVGGL